MVSLTCLLVNSSPPSTKLNTHPMELLVYKASAGSGKTFTLAVEYIKHLIQNPRAYLFVLVIGKGKFLFIIKHIFLLTKM